MKNSGPLKPGGPLKFFSKTMELKLQDYQSIINASSSGLKIKRVNAIRSEPGVQPGSNFCSSILRVELDVILTSGCVSTLNLIVKLIPLLSETKAQSDFVQQHALFPREIKVYEKLLKPAELSTPDRIMWPKYFGSQSDSVIILEDLKFEGYAPLPLATTMNYSHAVFTVREIAKFHALTSAALDRNRAAEAFGSWWVWSDKATQDMFFTNPLRFLARTMKESWGEEWTASAEKFLKCSETIESRINEISELRDEELNVVNHGDMWTSNILFKHNSTGQPESLKFIDFQVSSYSSFARDLTYFLYTSVEPATRRNHYNELIDAYRWSLIESLDGRRDLIEKTSRDAILKEMDRHKFLGFLYLVSIYAFNESRNRIGLGSDDLLALEAKEERFQRFSQMYSALEFRKTVEDDLKDFIDSGTV